MHATFARGLFIVGVLLAGGGCPQNQIELGMPEILRIAEKRLGSETKSYRCKAFTSERYSLDSERGKRIDDTRKKGDHALFCEPSSDGVAEDRNGMVTRDGGRIVFVSKYGVFQY